MENAEFISKIEKMPLEDLQKLIWHYEEELKSMEDAQKGNIPLQVERDRVGIPKPAQKIKERLALRNRISICQDILYSRFFKKVNEEEQALDYASVFDAQWVVVEKEPQIIIDNAKTDKTYWKKYGGNEPVQEYTRMSIIHCGDFYWSGDKNIDITGLLSGVERVGLTVPGKYDSSGKFKMQINDITQSFEKSKNAYTKLKLVKVNIQGAKEIEYFMLMDIPQMDKINPFELEKFLVKTYSSNTYQKQVKKSLESEKCLFGGIITQNQNGKLQLTFDDKNIRATVQANNYLGVYRTVDGKEKTAGTLQDALDFTESRQNRREYVKSLETIKNGLEGR